MLILTVIKFVLNNVNNVVDGINTQQPLLSEATLDFKTLCGDRCTFQKLLMTT